MTSEITGLNMVGNGSRVANDLPHVASRSSNTSSPVVIKKPNVELPIASKQSIDPIASRENVKEAVDILNSQMASNKRGIGFTISNDSNTPIVTVRNTNTGEVVRQIPNEVVVKLAKGLENFKGSIHNQQA